MRLDYGLYGVTIICFVIAGAFAASAVPGYTPREIGGIAVIIVFLILGVISGGVGYSARPKAITPTTTQPTPTAPIPIQEKPKPKPINENVRVKGVVDKLAEQAPEPLPPAPPQEIPSPPASESPTAEEVLSETLKPEQPTSPQLEEIAVAPPTEAELTKVIEPTKAVEEEKPREKRVRRRRKTQ